MGFVVEWDSMGIKEFSLEIIYAESGDHFVEIAILLCSYRVVSSTRGSFSVLHRVVLNSLPRQAFLYSFPQLGRLKLWAELW